MIVTIKKTREVIEVKLLANGKFESEFDFSHRIYDREELEFNDRNNDYALSMNCVHIPEYY